MGLLFHLDSMGAFASCFKTMIMDEISEADGIYLEHNS